MGATEITRRFPTHVFQSATHRPGGFLQVVCVKTATHRPGGFLQVVCVKTATRVLEVSSRLCASRQRRAFWRFPPRLCASRQDRGFANANAIPRSVSTFGRWGHHLNSLLRCDGDNAIDVQCARSGELRQILEEVLHACGNEEG
jgi:hypothetical protein